MSIFTKKKRDFIYDVKTSNISFLQTAFDLKSLGIKNYRFFLRLYDESLSGVDPFSPLLTQEQIYKIMNECLINPWYFLRECVRIPDQGGVGIPFQLHRANLAMIFLCLLGIDNYLTIPRQKGKTQSVLSLILWAFLFGTTNSEISFTNKSSEDSNNNLQRLKLQRDLLPDYMKMQLAYDEEGNIVKETDNVRSLYSKMSKNKIVTKPSANSADAADRIGRGSTQPIQQYDEVEFTKHVKTIVEAAGPAYLKAAENAARNGAIHFRSFTSTPGDLDHNAGQEAMLIVNEACKWSESFYDWEKDDIIDYVENNSGNRIVYIEYSYTQLGEGEEWFNKACQSVQNNPVKIKREILLKRIRGSSNSPYDQEELDALDEMRGTIIEELFLNKLFPLNLYSQLDRKKIYFVGIDVSDGVGRDNNTIEVVDPVTLETCAEFKSAFIGHVEFSKLIYTLVKRHIPKSIVIIERNRGAALIETLRDTDIFMNMYFDDTRDPVVDKTVDKLDAKGFLAQEAIRRRYYGVSTLRDSRMRMFDLLGAHISDFKEKFIGNYLIDDILSLVVTRTGKIEAGPGFHDDSLMAYLMVLYVYYHGNNLARFGFVKGQLPDAEDQNQGLTYDDLIDDPEIKKAFGEFSNKTMDNFDADYMAEVHKAMRESNRIDRISGAKTFTEDFDTPESEMDLDLFDYLND